MAAKNPPMSLDPKYDHYDYPTTAPEPRPGHPGHTTPEQDATVYQLRTLLEQQGCTKRLDTLTLLRFLRARKFNVELSKQMFMETEKWRAEFGGGVDGLVKTFEFKEKAQIFAYYPQYYHKTDKDGRPVYFEQFGKVDLEAMRKITTDERLLQHLVVEYEKMADPRLPACSRKAGCLLETSCSIMDMKGVGLAKASQVYGYLQRASTISQNHYPERLGRLYIINAPWGFSSVFAMIKRFLDPVTVAKIHVLGSGYQKELLQQIPAENLPVEFGGKCQCLGGCQLSDEGPWQDPQWARPSKGYGAGDNSIPATESLVGDGLPAGEAAGRADNGQEQLAGQSAPAPAQEPASASASAPAPAPAP